MLKNNLVLKSILICVTFSYAGTWTLDNHPGANFSTLAEAHSAASAGDTILIAGSIMPYAGIFITKQLTIIGPGFFLDENTGLQANQHSAKLSSINFSAGSNNSIIMGVHFTGTVTISSNGIKIRRCRAEVSGYTILLTNGADSCEISQSYLVAINPASSPATILISANLANIQINNNYIEHAGGSYSAISTGALSGNSAIYNNIIRQHVTVTGGLFYNNILREGTFTSAGVTPYNNIGNGTQFPAGMGNQQNIDMATVFVGSGATDSQWNLITEGPADAAGFNGTDCGMFENGQNMGYILSGIPPIPAIYDFSANTDLSNITVNARANQ